MCRRAVLVNDLSGFGRCSLVAGLTVLAAMGVEACPLPTAVLSAQTGYDGYVCQDQTDILPSFLDHWEKMAASFDGILVGYLTGAREAAVMQSLLDRFRSENTVFLLDPVMADSGYPYANYSEGLLAEMKKLAEQADILTPNISELCLLAGGDLAAVRETGDRDITDLIRMWAREVPGRKDRILIVTGVPGRSPDKIGNLLVRGEKSQIFFSPRGEGSFSGTGDLFAAVVLGGALRGDTPEDIIRTAGEFLSKAVQSAAENHVPANEGSEYEQYLWMLQKKPAAASDGRKE